MNWASAASLTRRASPAAAHDDIHIVVVQEGRAGESSRINKVMACKEIRAFSGCQPLAKESSARGFCKQEIRAAVQAAGVTQLSFRRSSDFTKQSGLGLERTRFLAQICPEVRRRTQRVVHAEAVDANSSQKAAAWRINRRAAGSRKLKAGMKGRLINAAAIRPAKESLG